uniref:Uncharacterized protein n=1 Tax=Neogobius melanostomus TaxID=47308 RepID=A0A8C6T5H9_9GOBI
MASWTQSSSEEQFLCSICLEVFSEPVSTPCGHNFCKRCISLTWDTNESCFYPLCKEVFSIRPQLKKSSRSMDELINLKEVQCDACCEPKLKAVKMCPTHQRPLELFCATDKSCVCTMCVPLEHKKHELLSLKEAFEQEKVSLQQTVAENQRLVEQRRLKVQEITAALELSEREAQRETQQMVKVFSDIMESVQRCLDHHTKVMEQSLSKHKERAQALIQQLQQEMCELEKSSTEAQQLSLSTDPLHFLQRCPDQLRRVQQFAVDVTLDPDTAHPELVLSKDLKQVHHTDVWKTLPDSPQRFTYYAIVLGKQSFSSGRFYFEVQVKRKTEWTLGVAQESVNRKGEISVSPENGFWTICLRNRDEYKALDDPRICLSPQSPPQKVGVFVDYGAGLVSFYDVDSADLLYSFTGCCFREKLFPFFSPEPNKGTNSAPLIISAV